MAENNPILVINPRVHLAGLAMEGLLSSLKKDDLLYMDTSNFINNLTDLSVRIADSLLEKLTNPDNNQ